MKTNIIEIELPIENTDNLFAIKYSISDDVVSIIDKTTGNAMVWVEDFNGDFHVRLPPSYFNKRLYHSDCRDIMRKLAYDNR